MSFCQICQTPLSQDGVHPPSDCPVYTGLVQGSLLIALQQSDALVRIAALEATIEKILTDSAAKELKALQIISDLMNRIDQLNKEIRQYKEKEKQL